MVAAGAKRSRLFEGGCWARVGLIQPACLTVWPGPGGIKNLSWADWFGYKTFLFCRTGEVVIPLWHTPCIRSQTIWFSIPVFMLHSDTPQVALFAQLAAEIRITPRQVQAAVELLDSGATVPFIARYRKEVTNNLDDIQLRELEARLSYLRELQERRVVVAKAIEEQGKLTPALVAAIQDCDSKQALEDLYLPFKLKRRTKAQIAREAGLEPLAYALFANPQMVPLDEAEKYAKPVPVVGPDDDKPADFSTPLLVLDGVRDLLSERWAQDPQVAAPLREWMWNEGLLHTTLASGKNENDPEIAKFRDYFEYSEPLHRVPSHRALAAFRGRTLAYLNVSIKSFEEIESTVQVSVAQPAIGIDNKNDHKIVKKIYKPVQKQIPLAEIHVAQALKWRHQNRPADDFLRKCVAWTWKVKLSLSIERELFARLRESAEKTAIKVFADNVRDLLLAAPAGPRVVMGLDPGIRTGVKVAVVDGTGKLLDTATVYPHEPRRDWEGSLHQLALLCQKHQVNLIAIGNGTASRETDKLAGELIKGLEKASAQKMSKVVVSEAGASVYSASEYASQEMPDVDVSLRGAASIARRLQDPLAELVKIDPKSIGVGQYQHDVSQTDLKKSLEAVVEDCVNQVGVDLNTASVPLLSRVSGLTNTLARALVGWREKKGAFTNRQQLLQVSGMGAKTFEQAAGFLRIREGENPLDNTGVHPETYPLVEKIIAKTGKTSHELMGRSEVFKTLRPEHFADAAFGVITVKDVLQELEKPGRDPRPDFKVAQLSDAVQSVADLRPGMLLEGTVSNVAAFGAFIDLGVHQDGLVHVSQLSHKFVTDAREVVKTGDIVKVQVVEVDLARQRISLTMKLGQAPQAGGPSIKKGDSGANRFEPARPGQHGGQRAGQNAGQSLGNSAMASAFAKLRG